MHLLLENLTVVRKHRTVLTDVSIEFYPGLTYVLGLNGSGKSTLLHCLLKTIQFEGNISLNSRNIRNFSRIELAKQIAFVPQMQQLPGFMTVQEFVLMGRYPHLDSWGSYRTTDQQFVQHHLESLTIDHLKDRRVSQLSGGELQRVKLAKALCQDTPILLLDEPAQSLDPKAKEELAQLLTQLARDGILVVCVTHELAPVLDPQVRVLGLRGGRLVLDRHIDHAPLNRPELIKLVYH
ncbi:MAG: ABC transporter ATP-binding protein [Bacteroidota bacterium]